MKGKNRGKNISSDKAKNAKKAFKELLNYSKKYKGRFIIVILFSILSTLFTITAPLYLGKATTSLYTSFTTNNNIDYKYIGAIIIFLLAIYILSSIFTYLQSFIMAGVSKNIIHNLRKDMSEKINKLPLKYYDNKEKGDILSKVTNDIEVIGDTISNGIVEIVTAVVSILSVVIIMFYISISLTIASIVTLILSFGLVFYIMSKSQKFYEKRRKHLGELDGHIEEVYSGHNIIKAYNQEENVINKFKKINNDMYSSSWKGQFFSSLMMPITSFVGNIGYVLICILGGYLVVIKRINIGDIVAFIQYINIFNRQAGQSASIFGDIQMMLAASERIFEFINEEEEKEKDKLIEIKDIKGNITFDHVHFGYNKNKVIIKDFNIKIKAGQKIAIVGPTGAGKTTIVNLLMRFYELNSGKILIDNIDISNISKSNLRKNIGMVLQDTWLFNGTIKENLLYGKVDATDEEILIATKAACANDFIETLPNDYDFILDEETSNISEGQKQLLTIARAMLANPKILILDEATSSVDTRTEVLIQEGMKNLMKDKTSFIIAHRLSTIRDADLILVMDSGNIVETGNHKELLNKKGYYYNLYNSQFEAEEN
ncbi:MAG TPA: ABC transporter ATP-binding protein [Bacilli bacterium]|nr:ABC transporter ATP-binding protein [Bacilli bacterium]